VAKATIGDRPDVLVVVRTGAVEEVVSGAYWSRDDAVTDLRPVVVLDTEFPQTVIKHLRFAAERYPALTTLPGLADQIKAQTRPAIQEPRGLGAVVEDADGHKFVRVADPIDGWMAGRQWQRIGGDINAVRNFGWSDLRPVRVLSEGVS
jgi:hypothetical protein